MVNLPTSPLMHPLVCVYLGSRSFTPTATAKGKKGMYLAVYCTYCTYVERSEWDSIIITQLIKIKIKTLSFAKKNMM